MRLAPGAPPEGNTVSIDSKRLRRTAGTIIDQHLTALEQTAIPVRATPEKDAAVRAIATLTGKLMAIAAEWDSDPAVRQDDFHLALNRIATKDTQ